MKRARTYRRRRLGAVLLVVAISYAVYVGSTASAEPAYSSYTVAPGDTLWSIAKTHYPPSEDPRPRIKAIQDINELDTPEIRSGRSLELPATE